MSPSLGAPLGLVALLGIPVLVALYFLRRKATPRTVSALFLWRATDDAVQAGPKMRRLQRETSLFLECAAVLCAAAFLSDLRCGGADSSAQHTVIVLDGSLSMRGGPSQGDRFSDRAKTRALRWIDASNGVVTLIETGKRPRVLAGPGATPSDAEKALRAWQPAQPAHPFEPAWALARELAGPGARVRFLTDALPERLPAELEVIAVGQPLANVAVVAAQRGDDTQTHVRLQIASFGDEKRDVPLELLEDKGAVVRREQLAIEPGRAIAVRLDLPRQGGLTVRLPDDALPEDGLLTLEPEPPRTVRVQNQLPAGTPANEAVSRVLASAPDLAQAAPADLVFMPAATTSPPWSVLVGATATEKAPLRTFIGPFFAERSHPLFEDVAFEGLVWTAGTNPPGKPLLTAGDRVLVSEEDGGRYHLNIDLGRSNVQRENAWPLLIANLADLRRRALPGIAHHNVALGEGLLLGPGSTGHWRLRGGGVDRALLPGTQAIAIAPGRYEVLRDGEVVDHVSVLGLDAQESDLRTRGDGEHAAKSGESVAGLLPPERARWPLVLLVALMLADYALAAPGRRRGFGRGTA